ncbi:MAG: aldo/keto reductase [Pseudomonadota bacterium]
MKIVSARGAEIPALGLGTWELRGDECARIVLDALRIGYRHIDTAAMYQNEEAVGAALMASGIPRDEIFVTTKVWLDEVGPGSLQASAEASLLRLGLEQVDLLLVHWPPAGMAVADMIEPLVDAQQRGLTRHIGVSNFPTPLLQAADVVSNQTLVTNQCEYHPYLNQDVVLSMCQRLGLSFTSYCPIGRGEAFTEPVLTEIALAHDKSPAQIVLRWHVEQNGVIAIPRTRRSERLAENLDIFDFSLAADEMEAISALTNKNHRICDYGFSPQWD